MVNTQSKFKQKNPTYFKDYYLKNKEKFHQRNKNRPSKRKFYYVIELEGKKFCFACKKHIPLKKVKVEDINNNDTYHLVKSNV